MKQGEAQALFLETRARSKVNQGQEARSSKVLKQGEAQALLLEARARRPRSRSKVKKREGRKEENGEMKNKYQPHAPQCGEPQHGSKVAVEGEEEGHFLGSTRFFSKVSI